MFYRPDLIQAEVTGTISGATDLTGGAWTMTWIVDSTSHKVIALDSDLVNGANPPTFLVPFATTDITAGASYVAMAAVFDGANEWRSSTGTPVITSGNPLSNVGDNGRPDLSVGHSDAGGDRHGFVDNWGDSFANQRSARRRHPAAAAVQVRAAASTRSCWASSP